MVPRLSFFFLFTVLLSALSACGIRIRTLSAQTEEFALSSGAKYVGTSRQSTFTVTGGVPPYSFSVDGVGSVSSVGSSSAVYSAPASISGNSEDVTIVAKDSSGEVREAALKVAVPGTLDTSFNSTGIVTADFSGAADPMRTVVLQPDGKIVVFGAASNGATYDLAFARFLDDGSPDPTFGIGGKTVVPLGSTTSYGYRGLLQPDGKFLLCAETTGPSATIDFGVVRLDSDGSLDPTFGTGGKVTYDFAGDADKAYAMGLQPDGKIVLAGAVRSSGNYDLGAVRLNSDGSVDTTFGTGGEFLYPGTSTWAKSVAVQPDGKILLAGQNGNDFIVLRLTSSGALDPGFGTGGVYTATVGGTLNILESLSILSDGSVLASGSRASPSDFVVVKLDSTGVPFSGFGTSGIAEVPIGAGSAAAYQAKELEDGSIFVVGAASNGTNNDFGACRLDSTGSLDSSFGTAGVELFPVGPGNDQPKDFAVDSLGRVLISGAGSNGTDDDLALIRIWP